MQRSKSVKCTRNWKKIQTHVLADFRETLTRSTTPSEQQSRQTLTEFYDVYTSAVSPGPSSLIGLVWLSNWQNTANSTVLLMMVSAVTDSRSESLLSFSPQPLSHGPLVTSFKPCPYCRKKWDCLRKRRLSPNSATVSLLCDSVDRVLGANDSVVTGHAWAHSAHAAADGTLSEMMDLLHDR